ncbi:MAG: hypothetical protein CM15mP65_02890 [Crocinitomicaceae bacterium]|nr:MAG: hypothetical protein CM15mP65_02890 [Crocinitomicaceae bacterium]
MALLGLKELLVHKEYKVPQDQLDKTELMVKTDRMDQMVLLDLLGSRINTGATGPAGRRSYGQDGLTVKTGQDGLDGATGPHGATDQGIQVPQDQLDKTELIGQDGQDGLDGATGPQGATGAQGIRGATGPAGQDGADGQDGQDGLDGATGLKELLVHQGIQGATGPAGQDGADGQDGQDGLMALLGLRATEHKEFKVQQDLLVLTVLMVKMGIRWYCKGYGTRNQGAQTCWADGLRQGMIMGYWARATGAQGIQGATGPAGADGITGPQGATGATGPVINGQSENDILVWNDPDGKDK